MKNRLTPEVLLSIFAVGLVGMYARDRIHPEFTVDFALFCVFVLVLLWLMWPSKRNETDPDH
jgi:membrane protein implicated in regulation of membrane protease activity